MWPPGMQEQVERFAVAKTVQLRVEGALGDRDVAQARVDGREAMGSLGLYRSKQGFAV